MSAKWLQFCIGLNVSTHYVLRFLNNKYVFIHFKLFPCVDISQVQGIQLLNWKQFKQSFINGYSTWKWQILWDLELWKIVCDPPKCVQNHLWSKKLGGKMSASVLPRLRHGEFFYLIWPSESCCGGPGCYLNYISMMTSSNGIIFRITDHLCGEFTGHWWIPGTKASDAELWCFLWSAPK